MTDEPEGPISLEEARRKRRRRATLPGDGSQPQERPVSFIGCPVKALGVIGEHAVFVDIHGQRRELAPSDFSSWTALLSLFGGHLEWILRECPPERTGMHSVPFNAKRLATALMGKAADAGVLPPGLVERAVGVWQTSRGIIVHAGDAIRVDGGEWVMPGMVVDSAFYERAGAITRPADTPAPASVGRELVAWLRCWNWHEPTAAELVAGWLFVGALGHTVTWRPHLWLLAGGGSGKSTLLGAMERMLPSVVLVNKATEPGLRRLIAGRAGPVMNDEGDDSEVHPNRLQSLVELARLLSGGTGLRAVQAGGGSADVQTFEAVGCVCWASIHPPPLQAQDSSRITFLELAPAAGILDEAGLAAWTEQHAAALWSRVINGLDRYRATLALLTAKLRDAEMGVSRRMADQAGSLIAGAWAMQNDAAPNDIQAEELLARFAWPWEGEPSDVSASDGEACLAHLLGSPAQQTGPRSPLGEIIQTGQFDEPGTTADKLLRAHGLRWVPPVDATPTDPGRPQCLAVAQRHPALNQIFAGTPWRGRRWASALGRMPDAIAGRRAPTVRLSAGLKPRCVLLPAPLFDRGET